MSICPACSGSTGQHSAQLPDDLSHLQIGNNEHSQGEEDTKDDLDPEEDPKNESYVAYQDDFYGDLYALFVLEAIPNEITQEFLTLNYIDSGWDVFWLAQSDYETLDDIGPYHGSTENYISEHRGCRNHQPPRVDARWHSPHLGKGLADVAKFIKAAPKPPKAISKTFFVYIDLELYQKRRCVYVCRIEEEGKVSKMGCPIKDASCFLVGHDRHTWDESQEFWEEEGIPVN